MEAVEQAEAEVKVEEVEDEGTVTLAAVEAIVTLSDSCCSCCGVVVVVVVLVGRIPPNGAALVYTTEGVDVEGNRALSVVMEVVKGGNGGGVSVNTGELLRDVSLLLRPSAQCQ